MHHLRFLLLLFAIPGCASLEDSFNVTPFLREQITGDSRRACLAREYQMQVRYVIRDDRNWAEASRFSAKGWEALKGENVGHWKALEFGLERTQLGAAQLELDAASSAADADPCMCAKAAAAYDGWLVAAARGADNQAQVEKNFGDALAVCRRKKE